MLPGQFLFFEKERGRCSLVDPFQPLASRGFLLANHPKKTMRLEPLKRHCRHVVTSQNFTHSKQSGVEWARAIIGTVVCFALFLHSGVVAAADANWIGSTGTQEWANGTNWSTSSAPGATTGLTNADVATFNTVLTGTTITIDAGRNIKSLVFATGASGAITIGSAGANAGEVLHLSSGGTIVVNSGVATPVTLNAPMVIEGPTPSGNATYTFENNSTAGDSDTNPNKMIINGSISGGTTGTVTLNFRSSAGNRSAELTSANIINGLISNGSASSLSVNIFGTTGQRGVWSLTNNNNSYTGDTTVSNGTLVFSSIANTGMNSSIGAGSNLVVGANTHVKYTGAAASTDRAISGTGQFYNNGTGALTLNGSVGSGLLFRGGSNFIVNGLVTGSGGLGRTDGGTVFLNNDNNSFTGDVSISDGAFRVNTVSNNGTNSAIGSNGRIALGQGSTTVGRFEYTGNSASTDRLILMRNDGATSSGRGIIEVFTAGQTLTFTSGVRVNNAAAANVSDLTLRGAGNGEIQGQIGGTASSASAVVSLQLVKTGTGTWILSGANTYARETTVSAGILNIRNSSALGAVMSNETTSTAIGAGTTVASGATLQLQNNISVGAEALNLSGTGAAGQNGALVNVSGTNSFGGAITLAANTSIASDSGRLNLTNTGAVVGSGGSKTLTLTGAGDGSLAGSLDSGVTTLTKNGTGLWTLSGTNAHTGATTVNAGTLNVTGSLGTSAVTVNNGGTFSMGGTHNGALTVANGGILAIGNAEVAGSTSTLTVAGSLVLNNTASLRFDLGTNKDLLQANGALTLDGIVTVTKGAGFGAGTYKLIDYTGALTDNGLQIATIVGYDLTLALDTANTDVNLNVTAINGQYWDGGDTAADSLVDGGNGIWTNAGSNWTSADGSANTSWTAAPDKVAFFEGAVGGTVQVQDTVAVSGLQFGKDYTLAAGGGSIQLSSPTAEVRVINGVTATLSAPLTGTGGINKTGDGTLLFTSAAGSNTYTGATVISAGTLKLGVNNTLPTGTALTIGSGTTVANLDMSTASQQVAALYVASNNSTANNNVTIGAGQTLTVAGTGGLQVGILNTVKTQTRVTFSGAGALAVNNTNAIVEFGLQTATSLIPGATDPFDSGANANTVNVDMSGLGSFSTNVKEFRVGQGLNVSTTLLLSNTSNSITADTVNIANSGTWNSGTSTVTLGTGANVISTNTLYIGVGKGVGTLKFASQTAGSAGTLTLGGKSSATVDIILGSSLTTSTAAVPTGILDLRGHNVTVSAGLLSIAKRSSSGNGGTIGTVYFDTGTFTAKNIDIATMDGNAGSSTATNPVANGQLIVSGGTFTVSSGGSLSLATYSNTNGYGSATGTLTISGGTFITNVDILEGGGTQATTTNTVSTLNLSGGILDMTGHNIGNATNTINNVNLTAGTLKDVGEINGGAAISKTGTGTLVLQGDSGYTGLTNVAAGTLLVSNNPSGTGSATGTNVVSVSSGATLGGNGRIASSVTMAAGTTLAPGGNATTIANNAFGLATDTGTLVIAGNLSVGANSNLAFNLKTTGTHGLTATFDPVTNRLTNVSGTSLDGGNDRLVVQGSTNFDTTSTITVTLGTGYTGGYKDTFDLLDWSGVSLPLTYYDDVSGDGIRVGGTADNAAYKLQLPDLTIYNSAWFWDVSQFGTTGVIAIVPEPGKATLALLGMVGLMLRRRKRRA